MDGEIERASEQAVEAVKTFLETIAGAAKSTHASCHVSDDLKARAFCNGQSVMSIEQARVILGKTRDQMRTLIRHRKLDVVDGSKPIQISALSIWQYAKGMRNQPDLKSILQGRKIRSRPRTSSSGRGRGGAQSLPVLPDRE